jgi:hypothetical protein
MQLPNLKFNLVRPKLNVHYIFLLPRARSLLLPLADFEELKLWLQPPTSVQSGSLSRWLDTSSSRFYGGILFDVSISAIWLLRLYR